ncbi:MAG: hypothetical protein M1168_01790 [Candidatus Marsarchaeota archaeon]|nr:hypothetical protein [Candidatus Marsarchaeota archaeon]MCL5094693.1 hypothetical protein [Candidatus Marsarchaeota archaeon]
MKNFILLILLLGLFFSFIQFNYASFTINHLNTTLTLNKNTSAFVNEVINVTISNESLNEYRADRGALNLKLENWQLLIGPLLTQHIINPHSGVYNFSFIPGPPILENNKYIAYLYMNYEVLNVTSVKQIAPRSFKYIFNNNVFNFEHVVSGEILPQNTTFTIKLPNGANNISIYPIPDIPANGLSTKYRNVTTLSWEYAEPLSQFSFSFIITENIQTEVYSFFLKIFNYLGFVTYIIIIAIIILFIFYTYFKARL